MASVDTIFRPKITRDICNLCGGAGYFFVHQDERPRWYSCPHCNGVGTLRCYAPPTIKIHAKG